MSGTGQVNKVGGRLKRQVTILGIFVAIFWILELLDWIVFRGSLDALGIRPRSAAGLRGVLLAPFLHAGFGHLIANTIPFLVLGWFVLIGRLRDFFVVTVITILVSGLGIWLTGANRSIHLGASGLIFGYFGFLVMRAYFERSLSSIVWSLLVIFLYGGMLFGIVPQGAGISWQAHLFGFAGGGLSAYLLTGTGNDMTTI
jgi:membrane associated rhomboid family serine protease